MLKLILCNIVLAPRSQLWNDSMLGTDDLENTYPCHKHRESNCRCLKVMLVLPIYLFYICGLISILIFKHAYSGSMEPSYYRGDILFLARKEEIVPGDIIVY